MSRCYGNVKEYRGSVLEAPQQTLTVTCNCEGAMGAGVAKAFKERVPGLYNWYRDLCQRGEFTPDSLWIYPWDSQNKQVLLFPTKIEWRYPSMFPMIEWNLRKLRRLYREMGITSLAIPPLGCGNGKLLYEEQIRDLMFEYLSDLDVDVGIYLGR